MPRWNRKQSIQRLIALVMMLGIASARCLAQGGDTFEGGEPRWELVESDCGAQLTDHTISLLTPHGGQTCEMFEVACSQGTLVLLAYPIEACAVLDEFQPRLWTRCSSGRIQLGTRVVFPFATHPVTGGRLTTILWGDLYSETGRWQMLEVPQLQELLNRETIAIRQEFGSDMKLDGAYIDSLVVNAYTGPGRYRVQVDDLELRGMIPLASIGVPLPANWRENWRWRHEVPSAEQRYWASPNRAPTWLQHRGEPLAWVKSLGFSGVVTSKLPSIKQLTEIKDAGLVAISPPPPYAVEFPEELLPTFRGWMLGAALDGRQAAIANEQAQTVAKLPVQLKRPIVAEALEDFFAYSRMVDELIVPTPLPTAAGSLREHEQWLSETMRTATQRGDGWVSVNLGITPNLAQQIDTATQSLSPSNSGKVADPLGLRRQVATSVMSGARGFLLRTFDTLEMQSPEDNATLSALRWLHNDLKVWGPWLVSGQRVRSPAVGSKDWTSVAWGISESYLLIAQNMQLGSEHCLPSTHDAPLQFGFAAASAGQQVFRLTHGTMERMDSEMSPAGAEWTVEKPEPIEYFVVTSNPLVMSFVRSQLENSAIENAADQLEIVAYNLSLAARVVEARFGGQGPAAANSNSQFRQLALAQRQLDQGHQALRSRQPSAATKLMYQASDQVQAILFDAYLAANSNLSAPQSSPFVVTPAALHLHWRLADACSRSEWRDLSLPGSEFSDLGALLGSGWSQQRRLEEKVDLRVELVPTSTQRSSGLRLAAYARPSESEPIAGGYAGASLRVRSAAIPVTAGQLIRIAANANVIQASGQPSSGLLVYDNQVGPSLGQLVRGNPGDQINVELYRLITEDGEFRLLAECRGECDIVLDSIRASVIVPATNRRGYFTGPRNDFPVDITESP